MVADEHIELTDAPASGQENSTPSDGVVPLAPKLGAESLPPEAFRFVEVGAYQRSKDVPEPQAVHINFDGQEADGRGIVLPLDRLADFSTQYRKGGMRSLFRFAVDSSSELHSARENASLTVLGNYYAVFDAKSSAEMVHSINQTIELMEVLKEQYDVPYEAAAVYYDGRAIELQVDHAVFAIEPGADLPQIFRRLTSALVGIDPSDSRPPAAYSQLNLSVYRAEYMSRIPATQVSADPETYCVRLSYAAFKRLSYQRLNEFVSRKPELQEREPVTHTIPAARDLYAALAAAQRREAREGDSDAISKIFYRVDEDGSQISTAKQLAPTLLKRLFNENRRLIGTFSRHLDRSLAGGFNPGDLYVVAGFPGSGTSSLALQLMNYAAEHHSAHCVFVGLQRGVEELFKRSLSHVGNIPLGEIDEKRRHPRGLEEDRDFSNRISAAYEKYLAFADRIVILEGAAAADLPRLTQFVRDRKEELKHRGADGNVLLVIDSLQLMVAVIRAVHNRRDSQEADIFGAVGEADVRILAGRLKALARELDITVLATLEHYESRGGANLEEPSEGLTQLFYDTQFADTVMLLSRHGASLKPLADALRARQAGTPLTAAAEAVMGKLEALDKEYQATESFKLMDSEFAILDILKNRSGAVDKIALCFHKRFSHFEPLEYLPPA